MKNMNGRVGENKKIFINECRYEMIPVRHFLLKFIVSHAILCQGRNGFFFSLNLECMALLFKMTNFLLLIFFVKKKNPFLLFYCEIRIVKYLF